MNKYFFLLLAVTFSAALFAAMLGAPVWLQLVWFFVVSIVALALTRPLARKYINAKVQPTNADALIGKECVVTEDIDNIRATGAVKISGREWTARSAEDVRGFHAGDIVKVKAIEGVKLIVE